MKDEVIAVVMGGPSKEREISFMTGNAILGALKEKGHNAIAIDLDPKNLAKQLEEIHATVVFNAVHGLYGEDGRLQSMLEMLGIPYTGSGVLASAIAMDKAYSKRVFQAMNIPTAECVIVKGTDAKKAMAEVLAAFTLPVVVKPASQGSSIGVEIVKNQADLEKALQEAFSYGDEIVVEEYVSGKELTVAVMDDGSGPKAFPVIQIVPHSGAYDFKSKYTKGATDYLVPAPLNEKETALVQEAGVAAYKALGCEGVARTDVILGDNGKLYVLEVNSIPGMTATSLVPKAAASAGIPFPELCELILNTAHK